MRKIRNAFISFSRKYPELLVFVLYLSFLLVLEASWRQSAIEHVYFQKWTSEDMMQTLPIIDLRDHPVESLANLHIQPPALDIIRALLALGWRGVDNHLLLVSVDQDLYRLWAVLFALMGVLIFRWLSQVTSFSWAALASLIFMIHPAAILYATFLENTFLFSLGILWSYYELWKLYDSPQERSIIPLVASFILIFFTRSIIQWPALLFYTVSLVLIKIPCRKILMFAVLSGTVVGIYTMRQEVLFDIPYTSSLAGGNCFHGLGDFSTYAGYGVNQIPIQPPHSSASVLNREYKLTGAINFNHNTYLQYHRAMLEKCYQRMLTQPMGETLLAFFGNFLIYLQPSSQFTTPHIIADSLPWRGVYNAIFSRLVLLFLLAGSMWVWIKTNPKENYLRGIGILLPAAYIFLMTVLFERGENMRYKFFLEPVFFVFLVAQLHSLSKFIFLKSKRPS
jgi:hypothetical protein